MTATQLFTNIHANPARLDGDWHGLDWRWDQNPKRADPPSVTKIYHWGCVMPWTEDGPQGLAQKPGAFRTQVRKHWAPYR